MKYKGLSIYKNTPQGDVLASDKEAKSAIKNKKLIAITDIKHKNIYLVIEDVLNPQQTKIEQTAGTEILDLHLLLLECLEQLEMAGHSPNCAYWSSLDSLVTKQRCKQICDCYLPKLIKKIRKKTTFKNKQENKKEN